jgi:class 3 adenylate cyclase/tetratricopeptide (TPR) repeat protein
VSTENLTVLFTDVVGSTELSQRLSVELADEVRRRHVAVLRQAAVETGGAEVKNTGDGLMVVFATASAALDCAVAMQQGVERDNRGQAFDVGLRVGLSGGEVVGEDGDYFGDPVVEAARLCAACEGGQVLIADIVRMTAGRRSSHAYRSLGPRSLNGLSDPVETVEVLWESVGAGDAAIPSPGRLGNGPAVGVVGRERELRELADAAKRAGGGDGLEVLLVAGEAGVGKTTLVAEAARAAFDGGAVVLFGHCEEDLAAPYQLFSEALGHFVIHADEEQLRAHVDAHGSELSLLVPELAGRLPDLPASRATDADTGRFLLFASVVGLLAMVSEQQLVVLVLDDLQWADQGSLQMLRHVASADPDLRLLVLGTYRDSELPRAHALRETLGVLRRTGGFTRLDLSGLDESGVIALLEAAADRDLDEVGVSLARSVYRETDGNPFFVSELLRHLSESGALHQDATGRWVADDRLETMPLPESIREVIGGRVVRLGPDAERVLEVAAVIGRDFDVELLAHATETSEDELLDILEAAAAVAVVREPVDGSGRYSFAHALIQHTLSEGLGSNRRAQAHRLVAEALEDLCGDRPGSRVGELARHWSKVAHRGLAKSVEYNRQAGDAALAALDPADALVHYADALDSFRQLEDTDPAVGLDLAIGLGIAQRQTGAPAFRETLLEAAHAANDLGDTNRLVAAALANNRGMFSTAGAIDADRVEMLELADDRLPADSPERALILATLCSELTWGSTFERRQALADEALAIAGGLNDDALVVHVLNSVTFPLLVPPLLDQSLARTADAVVRADRVGDPVLRFHSVHAHARAAHLAGDVGKVDQCLDIEEALAAEINEPTLNWMHTYDRAGRALTAGDTDLAEELATEALRIGTDGGQPDSLVIFEGQLLSVARQRGTMGEYIPRIEEVAIEVPAMAGLITAGLAAAHAQAEHPDSVRRILDELLLDGFDFPMDSVWLTEMVLYAEAAIAVHGAKYAEPLFDHLAPYSEQWVYTGTTSEGPVSHFLGGLSSVLGRYDEADSYFGRAVDASNRVGAEFFASRTNLHWGWMLTQRRAPDDGDRARDLLTHSRTVAAAHGYAGLERQATTALEQVH